ncbi:hypothetical protein PFICI_11430 [Pestalotiopsis fici W106-1]|uniref:Uncharacterized protein n=1 Tax=Pestalotiopsis fici (strain W106-1 / CGMCC3.15140) TaxID=1229662 RepID=W3WXE3_PESFW|nr:uncharacterized protein PFICI_11430 [Pestalotiopsis fici W106-1]ETS77556.1 hypothetical protein PFICI_11430 [Pestalotiopsis fici W106-1]
MSPTPANPRWPKPKPKSPAAAASVAPLPLPTPDEITFLTPDPFVPKPLVADILRTRYCIPGSIFLVEGVDTFRAGSSSLSSSVHRSKNRWRGMRLLLGDGELCIQALLAGDMHSYVDRGDVAPGAYVSLESFTLERAVTEQHGGGNSHEKGKGKMVGDHQNAAGVVYLAVTNLITVGWNNRLLAMLDAEEVDVGPVTEPEHASEEDAGIPKEAEVKAVVATETEPNPEPESAEGIARPRQHPDVDLLREVADAAEEDEDDDFFEVMEVSQDRSAQKRAEVMAARAASSLSDYSVPVDPDQLPWSSMDPTKPLKLTTLRAIPNLPYKQNWSTNVLAIVASISDVQASPLPPFSQRVARLAHPSTPKQVHLTVFLDAHDFTPRVGSVVLLLGVKNHRFDGGSLKKYASDKLKSGTRWWFDDPVEFTWCDVKGLHTWWHQKQLDEH